MAAFTYSVFGLRISSNLRIPGLPLADLPADCPDVEIHLGMRPAFDADRLNGSEKLRYASSAIGESGEPALRVWQVADGEFLRLSYDDGTEFWLDRKGRAVWAVWCGRSSLENTAAYVLGPILGLLLRLRGVICLHASAVAFGDRCAAFVGGEGAGKSTTAAAFAQRGCAVLSDDVVGLVERDGRFDVLPAYPHIALWPESVKMLYGSPEALPRFLAEWEKRRLPLGSDGTRFEGRALRLSAVYILGTREAQDAPRVEAISPQQALLSLVANTYATNLIDRETRAEEFSVLGRLVSSVPVRLVRPCEDATRLEDLCRAIQADFEVLPS